MPDKKSFFFLLLILLFSMPSMGKIFIHRENHDYKISANRFTESVTIEGYATNDEDYHVIYSQLEDIDDIYFESRLPGKNWEKTKRKSIKADDAFTSNFDSGIRKYSFSLTKDMQFRVTYTVSSSELKLITSILAAGDYITDTLSYNYQFNKPFMLEWKLNFPDSSLKAVIDSSVNKNESRYQFQIFNTTHKDYCTSIIYLSLHSAEMSGKDDLNQWIYALSEKSSGISDNYYNELKPELTNDTLQNIFNLFNKLRDRISYIAYEAGYGAWQHRKADFTIQNKKGDCKDMANVMHQCLKKMGIESYIAIIAANNKNINYVFPSAAAFNHAICLAKYRNQWICLDGTDDNSPVGYPSRHTQGRIAFCYSEKKAFEIPIPVVPADSNLIQHQFKLTYSNNKLEGSWTIILQGYAACEISAYSFNNSEENIRQYILEYLKAKLPKYSFANIKWQQTGNHLQIESSLSCTNQLIMDISGKKYLSLTGLPNPIKIDVELADCRVLKSFAEYEKSNIEISLDSALIIKENFKNAGSEKNASYLIEASGLPDGKIKTNFSYKVNKNEFNTEEALELNKLKKSFEKYSKSLIELTN